MRKKQRPLDTAIFEALKRDYEVAFRNTQSKNNFAMIVSDYSKTLPEHARTEMNYDDFSLRDGSTIPEDKIARAVIDSIKKLRGPR